jgi:hypothetical protein
LRIEIDNDKYVYLYDKRLHIYSLILPSQSRFLDTLLDPFYERFTILALVVSGCRRSRSCRHRAVYGFLLEVHRMSQQLLLFQASLSHELQMLRESIG